MAKSEMMANKIQEMVAAGHPIKHAVKMAFDHVRKMSGGGVVADMDGEVGEDEPLEDLNEKAETKGDDEILAEALGKSSMDMDDDDDEMSMGGEVKSPEAEPMMGMSSGLTEDQKKAIVEKKKNRKFL